MKKITVCVLLSLMLMLLSGCWNNRNITDLSIVTAIGLDKAADGNIELTLQMIAPLNQSSSQLVPALSTSSSSALIVSAEGATVFDAVRNVIPKVSKKAYFSQVRLIVISEDIAREGLDNIWGFFERDHEMEKTVRVIVVKNDTAKSILEVSSSASRLSGVEIADTIDNEAFGKNIKIEGFKVSEFLSKPLTGLLIGVIDPNGAEELTEMKVEGGAVFKNAKLAGFLDNDEARGYLFASNQTRSTILTIANPKEPGKLVSIEVIGSKSKLTANLEHGKPKLGIKIKAFGNIGDEQGSSDLTNFDAVKILESESEELIAENIRDMLKKSQQTYDIDLLNFNDMLYKHHYYDFEKIKENWNELYADADISVNVEFTINRTGLITKPAYVQSMLYK